MTCRSPSLAGPFSILAFCGIRYPDGSLSSAMSKETFDSGTVVSETVIGMPIGRPSTSPEPKSGCRGSEAPIEETYRAESGCTGSVSTGARQKLSGSAVSQPAAGAAAVAAVAAVMAPDRSGSVCPDTRQAQATARTVATERIRRAGRGTPAGCAAMASPHPVPLTPSQRREVPGGALTGPSAPEALVRRAPGGGRLVPDGVEQRLRPGADRGRIHDRAR